MKVDFDHVRGSEIADEILRQIREERITNLIAKLKAEFGNDRQGQYYFSYGKSKEGEAEIIGFGETPYEAAEDFFEQFLTAKAK